MNKIQIHPDICNGKPTISGTRITVQTIMGFLAAGDSIPDILEEYPNLTEDDIYACLQFVTKLMARSYQIKEIA
ncbi:DUF433 domain-containing protein [Synechocystis sp. LKSZ1]|uniref:DUF433 domain-containing protein n=1 Tax=Synechocystis sp. LKSZ1 TaxID=3144951 RepID=UPI00336BBB03